jgi:CRP-like cAMP-binding protein
MKSIETIPLFKHCNDEFLNNITASSTISCHPKGKTLFIHGDDATRFYYIKSGWVKLYRETLEGTQAIVDILPAGNIFGETSIFENATYPYSAEIVEKADIISLPITHLKTEIENNNKLAMEMLQAMARYRRRQDTELEHLSIQNAPQRIGCFLLRLADQSTKNEVKINLPYDKTLVASRLGMQPETFSRALNKLRDKTGIRIKGSTIEVDKLDQLMNYSCAACSSEFPCKDIKA